MCPFSVTLQRVPDQELGPLLIQLAHAGFHDPIIEPVGADGTPGKRAAAAVGRTADLPEDWRLVQEREGAVVPVAGSARALLPLPRLHWHDAC